MNLALFHKVPIRTIEIILDVDDATNSQTESATLYVSTHGCTCDLNHIRTFRLFRIRWTGKDKQCNNNDYVSKVSVIKKIF